MDRGIQAGNSIPGGFEQVADGNAKDGSDLRQPAGANPVRAFLVFLHLLKGYADPFGEHGLAHAAVDPKHADLGPHHRIERARLTDRHCVTLPTFSSWEKLNT